MSVETREMRHEGVAGNIGGLSVLHTDVVPMRSGEGGKHGATVARTALTRGRGAMLLCRRRGSSSPASTGSAICAFLVPRDSISCELMHRPADRSPAGLLRFLHSCSRSAVRAGQVTPLVLDTRADVAGKLRYLRVRVMRRRGAQEGEAHDRDGAKTEVQRATGVPQPRLPAASLGKIARGVTDFLPR